MAARAPKGSAIMTASRSRLPEIEGQAWKYMQRRHVITVAELQSYLSTGDEATRALIHRFEAEGRIRVLNGGNASSPKRWVVADAHLPPADRATDLLTQFWRTARKLKSFTAIDLIAHCTPEVKATREEAAGYAGALLRAGYLRVLQTAIPGEREARYQLVSNTGPQPPREQRVRGVWDDNLARYTYLAGIGRMGDLE